MEHSRDNFDPGLSAQSKEHIVVWVLRCVRCKHEWEASSGWLPKACPSCLNRIEHGDHLQALYNYKKPISSRVGEPRSLSRSPRRTSPQAT